MLVEESYDENEFCHHMRCTCGAPTVLHHASRNHTSLVRANTAYH
jgi:hypothetical protein